jgi:hypothetical protein
MHFLEDSAADQAPSGSRMSLAQTTITTTDTRKIKDYGSGRIDFRGDPPAEEPPDLAG